MKIVKDDSSYIPYAKLTGIVDGGCFYGKAEFLPLVAPYVPPKKELTTEKE